MSPRESSASLSLVRDDAAEAPKPEEAARVAPVPEAQPEKAKPKRKIAKYLLPALIAVAGLGTTVAYAAGANKQTTDDAQIEGRVASVAARVPGQVKRVLVQDNQLVQAGDILVELDDRDLAAKEAAARADVAAAKANLRSAKASLGLTEKNTQSSLLMAKGGLRQASALRGTTDASIDQARADLGAAESRRTLAKLELQRTERLFQTGAVSKAANDTATSLFEQADAGVNQAKARVTSAQANQGNSSGTIEAARGKMLAAESGPEQVEAARAQVELAEAKLKQSEAAERQAELNLSYTRVRAETSGVVSRRSVELGQLVSPERPLMAIVPLDDTWVVANFKEDQIASMHAGQNVRIKVDAFPGRTFTGHVDSLAGGTGSRFSLLPPDNASGNFTKVVQRVPVLVRLDEHGDTALRPGMSAVATVFTK